MRTVTIFERPPAHPYVCFKCKTGEHARKFFVDIGMDTELDGTIYLCDSCMEDLGRATEMFMTRQQYLDKVITGELELQALRASLKEFEEMKELWMQHYSIPMPAFFLMLKDMLNGPKPGNVDSSSGEPNIIEAEYDVRDNVVELVQDNADSSGSNIESSGQAVTAPVIPLFS